MAEAQINVGQDFASREFSMEDKDFQRIKSVAFTFTGITLSDHKKSMVYGRLTRRLRQLGLRQFSDYCDVIEQKNSPEITDFINAITTNLTSFFRENHHFESLRESIIPKLIKSNANSKRIRIWSAGCSTGEEPYSIAMVLKGFSILNNWDVKILATDLDTNVVEKAKSAVYTLDRIKGLDDCIRGNFDFISDSQVRVRAPYTKLITFKPLNLLKAWPMKGPFDVIFCRNVVIYFNSDTQRILFDRFADILTPEGSLFIGHSESLHNICNRFTPLGRTEYARSI